MKNVMYNLVTKVAVLLIIAACTSTNAQFGGGYYVYSTSQLSDTSFVFGTTDVPVTFDREDVRAVGIGKTQVANGKLFNGMMYNPALLTETRTRFDVLGISASLPFETFSATDFLRKNVNNFRKGDFLKVIEQGIREYLTAQTQDQLNQAARKINSGLEFPKKLLSEVVGNPDDPYTHGLRVVPDFQMQIGNFGLTVNSNAQIGFLVIPTEFLVQLNNLNVPEDGSMVSEQTLYALLAIIEEVITYSDNVNIGLLPQAFAFSYVDLVSTAGYGLKLNDFLSVGANLKVINRRFSTKLITYDNYENILTDARKDISKSVMAFTMDLGALVEIEKIGMRLGLSLQNVIPPRIISSKINFPFNAVEYDYLRDQNTGEKIVGFVDQNGNIQRNPNGDTMLVAYRQLYDLVFPFDLSAPFLSNIGVMQKITKDWDVSLDMYDLFAQDTKFVDYTERIRIGTEYRLLNNMFAFRLGFADHYVSAGMGFNFNYFALDLAYAFDTIVYNDAIYAQVKFGF